MFPGLISGVFSSVFFGVFPDVCSGVFPGVFSDVLFFYVLFAILVKNSAVQNHLFVWNGLSAVNG